MSEVRNGGEFGGPPCRGMPWRDRLSRRLGRGDTCRRHCRRGAVRFLTRQSHVVVDGASFETSLLHDASFDGSSLLACYANAPFAAPPWKPPTALHQGACSTSELQKLDSCVGESNCSSGSATCDACAMTDVAAMNYGPVVRPRQWVAS